MKRETLAWAAANPHYTQRFADRVGKMCEDMSVSAVAEILGLGWHAVKDLEKDYMRRVLAALPPTPLRAIGIDEVSIRKGHEYRIVVSDLEARRPVWFGGEGRKESDMDRFYTEIGDTRAQGVEIAVMDMWKPFRVSTTRNAPNARIVYDKFHVIRHLGDALDDVRNSEYKRASDKDRAFIKGQKYTLLSHRANLDLPGKRALRKLLAANRRIHKAYLLKESFGQLWDYQTPGHARRFFENWKAQLRWQRLPSYVKFAAMIERNWDGIAAYSRPENKVSLGFVEGVNNKIRVIQRRAYGLHDEEYLRLKILTAFARKSR